MIVVPVRHDHQREPLHPEHGTKVVRQCVVGSGIDQHPLFVWRAYQNSVALTDVHHLDADVRMLCGERNGESRGDDDEQGGAHDGPGDVGL